MDSEARAPVSGDIPMERDPVSSRIEAMRQNLRANKVFRSIIRRVPDHFRCLNQAAYKPQLLSIGPYHHGEPDLHDMQACKNKCLDKFLERSGEHVNKYASALRGLEAEARGSYEGPVTMDSNAFLEMLLLDGCFILERILQRTDYDDDLLSLLECNQSGILRDMLLLENQLPFTVVKKLFSLSNHPQRENGIKPHVVRFLDDSLKNMNIRIIERHWQQNRNAPRTHLLGIVQLYWYLLPSDWRGSGDRRMTEGQIIPPQNGQMPDTEQPRIYSAITLKKAGIQFSEATSLLKFKDGILEIPRLAISKEYEFLLRNLIAYEHLPLEGIWHKVINFAMVMQFLITVPADVELLRRRKIIPSEGGGSDYNGDQQIVQLFQTLVQGIRPHNFIHLDPLTKAKEYGSRRWIANCIGWLQKL